MCSGFGLPLRVSVARSGKKRCTGTSAASSGWHVELASRIIVNPRPHSPIIRDLPLIWWKGHSREVLSVLIHVVSLLVGGNLLAVLLVAFVEADVVCHTTIPDVVQGLFGRVQSRSDRGLEWLP